MKNRLAGSLKIKAFFLLATMSLPLFTTLMVYGDENPSKINFSGYFIQDHNHQSGSLFGNAEPDDRQSTRGGYLRKLKFGANYKPHKQFSFKTSVDYRRAENSFEFSDIYAKYKFTKNSSITLGRFNEPFGFANLKSTKQQGLLERPLPSNAMTFSRNRGLMYSYTPERWSFSVAQMSTKNSGKRAKDFSRGDASVARITALLYKRKKNFFHIGAAFNQRKPGNPRYDVDEQVLAHEFGNLLDSQKFDATKINVTNIEAVGQYKRLLLIAEAFKQDIEEIDGLKHSLSAEYIELIWTIIGGKKRYNKGEVEHPKHKPHTLELAYRHSSTDLESRGSGDRATINAIALNYYKDSFTRVSLEYGEAKVDRYKNSIITRENGNNITLRLQLMFKN